MEFELSREAIIDELRKSDGLFYIDPNDEVTEDFAHFYFVHPLKGEEVIYDVALYTLQMHYNSELFEIAEQEAEKRFPDFKKINSEQELEDQDLSEFEEEVGLFMAEVVMELEDEEAIKVSEHIDVDTENPVGIGLDVGLNVSEIDKECIDRFIHDYTSNSIELDKTLFSFQSDTL